MREEIIAKSELVALSKSPFFLQGDTLSAHYTNIVYAILKRNLLGIFLSLILVAGIIASLLYLLRIIRQQAISTDFEHLRLYTLLLMLLTPRYEKENKLVRLAITTHLDWLWYRIIPPVSSHIRHPRELGWDVWRNARSP